MAIASARPPLVEASLDLLHRLIALRFLQGAAHAVASDPERAAAGSAGGKAATAPSEGGRGQAAAGPDQLTQVPAAVAVELMCRRASVRVCTYIQGSRFRV